MITAKFKKRNNQIYWYQVIGHAGYADIGKDIVCAGVSALYITVTNTLLGFGHTFERDGGYFVLDATDADVACLKVLYDGIRSIAEQYPDNVKVEEQGYMSDYWQKRAIKAEKKVNDGAKQLEDVVVRAYRQAQDYITKQVAKLFARTKQQTGLDEDEAKRMLNQTVPAAELVELRRLAKDISNPDLQNQAKKRLTGLALKHRITVAEDLTAKSYLVSKQVADVQLEKQTSFYIDTIDEAYKEAIAESIIRDAQPSVKKGHEFKQLSTKSVENILNSHWKGSNYSRRIWGDTEALAKRLEELFTVEALTGMSEFKMAQAIASEFDRSINVSRRLIRTEANYMANQGKLKAWQTRGIERYQIIAILDLRTSEICQHQDHKVYLVEDAEVGVTMPPFHPWCRSIIAYYSERLANTPRKAIDPITGKTVDIKGDATYNDWMDKLKDLHSDDEIEKMKQKTINLKKRQF